MSQKKNNEELLKDLKAVQHNTKVMDEYDQAQDLDGGMSSWTYGMGPVTTTSTSTLDDDLAVSFDVSDNLYQSSFDFDHDLRKKYPALQDAYNHYQNIKQMCETREKEEDAS